MAQLGELDAEERGKAKALAHQMRAAAISASSSRRPTATTRRCRCARSGCGWSAVGPSATCGWAGRCGAPCSSTPRATRSWRRPRGGGMGADGGDPGPRAAVRALERAARYGGLVPTHGALEDLLGAAPSAPTATASTGRSISCCRTRRRSSTHFAGLAARDPLAQRGHSRDFRPDCKQVCIALVGTREAMPLGYEVLPLYPGSAVSGNDRAGPPTSPAPPAHGSPALREAGACRLARPAVVHEDVVHTVRVPGHQVTGERLERDAAWTAASPL